MPPAQTQAMQLEEKMLVTRTPDEETEDGRIRNREAATKIRDAWIYKQIRAHQDEFTQYRTVSFFNSWLQSQFCCYPREMYQGQWGDAGSSSDLRSI